MADRPGYRTLSPNCDHPVHFGGTSTGGLFVAKADRKEEGSPKEKKLGLGGDSKNA